MVLSFLKSVNNLYFETENITLFHLKMFIFTSVNYMGVFASENIRTCLSSIPQYNDEHNAYESAEQSNPTK